MSSGEASNANTVLEEKANDFDSSVANMEVFIRNNGEEILKTAKNTETEKTEEITTATGSTSTGATVAATA